MYCISLLIFFQFLFPIDYDQSENFLDSEKNINISNPYKYMDDGITLEHTINPDEYIVGPGDVE